MTKSGNAECMLCGLRASSKNAAVRNVFPIWPEEFRCGGMMEGLVAVRDVIEEKGTITLFGLQRNVTARGEGTSASQFAQFIRDYRAYDPELEHLEKLLCSHYWAQDEGTAMV